LDTVYFNKVDLQLTKDPLQKNSLHFSVIPYLMPASSAPVLSLDSTPTTGLKKIVTKISEEIKYEVQQLDDKMKFKFDSAK
jgi:hypothetical protein